MTSTEKPSKSSLRARADKIKAFRCKNLITVIENPRDIRNIGAIVRNVNALGAEKVYIVTDQKIVPGTWEQMRESRNMNAVSASAIKWSFVKVFKNTESCMDHLEKLGFVSAVTSPYMKGRHNAVLHEHDYTGYKKLAVWFGSESRGISEAAVERSVLCISIPMYGIIESLNLGTSSGIVLYEITKQRRAFQALGRRKAQTKKVPVKSEAVSGPEAHL